MYFTINCPLYFCRICFGYCQRHNLYCTFVTFQLLKQFKSKKKIKKYSRSHHASLVSIFLIEFRRVTDHILKDPIPDKLFWEKPDLRQIDLRPVPESLAPLGINKGSRSLVNQQKWTKDKVFMFGYLQEAAISMSLHPSLISVIFQNIFGVLAFCPSQWPFFFILSGSLLRKFIHYEHAQGSQHKIVKNKSE